ncbi:hypothetical protein HUJ04_007959 [Dendroctonus ponderosae]|uniref:MARVEL domain-containing protein n=1 Tax=Dendroctonus ponderosae TaxID=77166 RepID=A0AAR5QDM4_DENPD|nr:hypothetical protein HUJ04_007959 [Dendroctonus ponderosae]
MQPEADLPSSRFNSLYSNSKTIKVADRESVYDVPKKVRMSAEAKKVDDKSDKPVENKEKEQAEKKIEDDDVKEKDVAELKPEAKESLGKKIKKQWQLILKVLQLIVCALCFAFFFQPANQSANIAKHHLEEVGLIFLAFVGYMHINVIFIVSRCIKDKIPFRVSALFSLIAAILFFVAGILLIVDRRNKFQGAYYEPHVYLASMLSAATALSFINAVLFAVDGVYTFILRQDF